MTLLTTGLAIAGLAAMAIPIIIHLLARQRRRPIEWAAMRFLLEAFKKHKRRLQLEQIILLAVRCLVLGLLGLALARPILENAGVLGSGGSRSIYLVIDDGLVSGVMDADNRTALDRHIAHAGEIINSLGPGDSVGVITAARPAQPLLMPPSTDHSAVKALLEGLEPRQTPTDMQGAFSLIRGAVDESKQTQKQAMVYLLSEFRGGSARLDAPLPATHAEARDPIKLLASPPAAEPIGNVQIASIEPVRSLVLPGANDGSGQVTVRLKRAGEQLAGDVTRVRLAGDGFTAPEPRTVRWQPGQAEAEAEFIISQFPSANDRQIALTASVDDDALNADNQRHQVIDLRSQIRVLLIDRRSFGFERNLDRLTAGQWIRRALEPFDASPMKIVESEPAALDLADVRSADVAIVPRPDLLNQAGWDALKQFVQRDNLLIVMPPAEINVHQWTEKLAQELNLPWRINLEVASSENGVLFAEEQPSSEILRMISSELQELTRSVQVKRFLPVQTPLVHAQPLLVLADGSPLLVASSPESESANAPEAAESPDLQNSAPDIDSPAHGLIMYLAAAPELSWTDMPVKPLMVPLFQEMVRQGLSVIRASQRVNVGEPALLARGAAASDLQSQDGATIPLDANGRSQQPLGSAGVYTVRDQTGQSIGKLAVNIDPAAGETRVQSAAEVEAWLGNSGPWTTFDPAHVSATTFVAAGGSPVAGILLAIVLVLVLVETVLARWFSHAFSGGRDQSDVRSSRNSGPLVSDFRPVTATPQGLT